jgi:hypothetical protein
VQHGIARRRREHCSERCPRSRYRRDEYRRSVWGGGTGTRPFRLRRIKAKENTLGKRRCRFIGAVCRLADDATRPAMVDVSARVHTCPATAGLATGTPCPTWTRRGTAAALTRSARACCPVGLLPLALALSGFLARRAFLSASRLLNRCRPEDQAEQTGHDPSSGAGGRQGAGEDIEATSVHGDAPCAQSRRIGDLRSHCGGRARLRLWRILAMDGV